jgi:uncharacterized membrane protein
MTETAHTGKTNRDRLTYIGLWALAAIAAVVLPVGGYPVAGAVAFFVLGGATFALGRPESMFDERDADIIEEASANTVMVLGISSGVVFPMLSVLAALGYVEFPPWLGLIGLFVAVLFALWVSFLLFARRRR